MFYKLYRSFHFESGRFIFKKASLLSIPAIFFYALMTGANPPALRSAIMLSCIFIALALNREPLIFNPLALSALCILVFEPQQMFTASFQMSYGATIGIVCFYKDVYGIFRNVKNYILCFSVASYLLH
jgi:competence protein ComEC